MTPVLIVHVAAGRIGIISGYRAVIVAKGERTHRAFGTAFVLSMLTVSVLAVYLALFVLLAFWMIRVRLTNWFKNDAIAAAY